MMSLERLVNPATAAVIVVDVQNDFCHPDGAQAGMGADVSLAAQMAACLKQLLADARAAGVRCIFVRTHHSPWTNSETWLSRGSGRHARGALQACLPGTWGADFYAGIEPRQSADWDPARHDLVVTKHRYSGFVGTNLELALHAQGIKTLLMTGTASDTCVEATARDGFMRDFEIVYVSDCTVTSTADKHQAVLQRLRGSATVASSGEIAAAWQRVPEVAGAR